MLKMNLFVPYNHHSPYKILSLLIRLTGVFWGFFVHHQGQTLMFFFHTGKCLHKQPHKCQKYSSSLDIEPLEPGPQDEIPLLPDLSSAERADGLGDILHFMNSTLPAAAD